MVKRILLINPNFKYFPGLFASLVNYRRPPLGIAYLAAYIRKKYEVNIKICDAAFLNWTVRQVLDYISEFKPDLIGISTTTLTVDFARKVALGTKGSLPEAVIIFGGPHVTARPFENLDVADICVIGEGEEKFSEIISAFLQKLPLENIKGTAFKKNGKPVKVEDGDFINNLDELPFPARDLLPKYNYCHIFPYRVKNPYYNTIITSRGCSYNCNFCSNELMWKRKVRYRSLDNILEELEELENRLSTSLLFISDDNFTGNLERAYEFCKLKQKYFSKIKWICHARADCLSLDLLEEMEAAGCLEIQIGVESGDDLILDNFNKRIQATCINQTFKMIKKTKINAWATFIIGNEKETKESIERTIAFAKKIDPTYATFLFLCPLPGTKCFDVFYQKGYIKTFDWSRYAWHGEPIFETERLSKDSLLNLRKKAYKEFYIRPKMVFRYLYVCLLVRQWKVIFSNSLILFKFLFNLIKKNRP